MADFKFQDLVDFVTKLNSVKRGDNNDFSEYGRATITQARRLIIQEFVSRWRYKEKTPFLTVLRMILPDRDTGRRYKMKEVSLINSILQAYGVTKNSEEYQRLMSGQIYDDNKHSKYHKAQKIASAMAEIISKRQPRVKGGVLTLKQVDSMLDSLSSRTEVVNSEGKASQVSPVSAVKVLSRMFEQMNHDELQTLMIIILKHRMIGHSETALLRTWHKDAPDYFSAVISLEAVCARFEDPDSVLDEYEKCAHVLLPFAPQLAFHPKSDYAEIVKRFQGQFFIEEKLDGERLQLHMQRSKASDGSFDYTFKFYSRKGTDYTLDYGSDLTSGSLSPYLAQVINPKRFNAIDNIILDGEVLGFDVKRQVVLPFGTLKAVNIEVANSSDSFRPVYVIFDLLMLNSKLICNTSLKNRRALLEKLITPKPGYIELVRSSEGSTAEDIKKALQGAVEANSEGIMLKSKGAKYKLGVRDPAWIKIKPEYLQELGTDLDLCVIGKVLQKKPSFFCGLRVDDPDGTKRCLFQSFCKIANGIGAPDLERIESLLHSKWKKFDVDPPPESLLQYGNHKPHLWVDPKDSIVIQIKARSIEYGLYGKGYKTESTVLSGYMKSIREDKSWKDALSLNEFMEWKSKGAREADSFETKKPRKRRKIVIDANPLASITALSNLFEDLTFMILSDYKNGNSIQSVKEIEKLAKSYGAEISSSESNQHGPIRGLIPLATRNTLEANSLHRSGFDIIHTSWLYDCVSARQIVPFEPRHCFKVAGEVIEAAECMIDEMGDGFYSNSTVQSLRKFAAIDNGANCKEFRVLARSVFPEELDVFEGLKFYIVSLETILRVNEGISVLQRAQIAALKSKYFMSSFEVAQIKHIVTFNGGSTTSSLSKASFIVIPSYLKKMSCTVHNEQKEALIDTYNENLKKQIVSIRKQTARMVASGAKIPRIVNHEFLFACSKESVLIDAEKFYVE